MPVLDGPSRVLTVAPVNSGSEACRLSESDPPAHEATTASSLDLQLVWLLAKGIHHSVPVTTMTMVLIGSDYKILRYRILIGDLHKPGVGSCR